MKPKQKTVLFPSKPKATQRRNSLLRTKDELRRRSVRIVLSPLPHFSPFKADRKSITNFSPRRSVLLVDQRSLTHDGSKFEQTNDQTEQLRIQVVTPRFKKRRSSKRKTEAEKLHEAESSKACSNEGNIFSTRRALRSRLILTPKSPLVRVKRSAQQSMKSRKISLTSLNKFLSRDVVIELERAPQREESSEIMSPQDDIPELVVPVDKNDSLQKQILPKRDVRIILEKLPTTTTSAVEVENVEDVSSPVLSPSKRNASCLEPPLYRRESSKVFKSSEHAPLREIRIMLDKLPNTGFTSAVETPRLNETDTRLIDMEEIDEGVKVLSPKISKHGADNVDDQSVEKSREILSTPTTETAHEQPFSAVTPLVISESQPAPVRTPASGTVDNTETGSKKTPGSLDIPLRRVTIVKSKFAKLNRALESSPEVTPVKVRPNFTYLFSPSSKLKTTKSNKATTLVSDDTSSLEPSIMDFVSSTSSSSTVENYASGATSVVSESTKSVAPPPSSKMTSTTLKSQSRTEEANILHRIEPIRLKFSKTKQIFVLKSPVHNDASGEPCVVSESSQSSAPPPSSKMSSATLESQSRTDAANISHRIEPIRLKFNRAKQIYVPKSPVLSKLSYDTSKSSKSPNKVKSVVVKKIPKTSVTSTLKKPESEQIPSLESPPCSQTIPLCTEISSPLSRGQLLTAKSFASSPNPTKMILAKSPSQVTQSAKSKTPSKSPLNRGRMLTEQSLAASPKHADSGSPGSVLNRSRSNLSSGSKAPQYVTYRQKWASAGDLLRTSSKERGGKMDAISNTDLSTVITPLDPPPTKGVFSNAKTCASILSTLKSADRNKSKSAPEKLPLWSASEVAGSSHLSPKTSSSTVESHSQPDLSEKLSEVQINSTKTKPTRASTSQSESSQPPKTTFHIPKVKPGDSFNFKKPITPPPPSSLPRSGFTPSPPTKASLVGSVLSPSTYVSGTYTAPRYTRQLPPKSSRTSNSNTFSAKSHAFRFIHTARPRYFPGSQTSLAKPPQASGYHSSPTKPPYTTQFLSTKPPHTSTFYSTPNLGTLMKSNDPRSQTANVSTSARLNDPRLHSANVSAPTKPVDPRLQAANLSMTSTKPNDPRLQASNTSATSTKPSYPRSQAVNVSTTSTKLSDLHLHDSDVPSSTKLNDRRLHSSTTKPPHSSNIELSIIKPYSSTSDPSSTGSCSIPPYKPVSSNSKTPITTPAAAKPHLPVKPVIDYKPPAVKKPSTPTKSKSRPFKTAYMSSRSSNNDSFSKCLPSGPQYSPTYSKYLQNGFSYIPKAQYKVPEATKPVASKPKPPSPGTNEILRWSTSKPWNVSKSTATPAVGPSNSLNSSVLSSNPAYSPLCPQFDTQKAT